jgi:hypothetical protein
MESFGQFKICGELKEVATLKSVPNLIYYLHDFLCNFSQFLAIFTKPFRFRITFKLKSRCHVGPTGQCLLSAPGARLSGPSLHLASTRPTPDSVPMV